MFILGLFTIGSSCFLEVWSSRIPLVFNCLCQVKVEAESAAAKKRKTEWHAALKKMPGDVSFAKVGCWVNGLF